MPLNALLAALRSNKEEMIPEYLNQTHLMILFQIDREFGTSQSQLAQQLGITKQSVGVCINFLVKRKFVVKIKDPIDGRGTLIRLTEKAWSLLDHSRKQLKISLDQWKNKLGSKDFKKLNNLLMELNRVIREENDFRK